MWVPIISFLLTVLFTPILGNYLKEKGIVGTDVNKPNNPKIPEAGGIAILCVFLFSAFLLFRPGLLNFYLIILLSGLFGLYDNMHKMGPFWKVVAPAAIGFLFYPYLPLILLPLAIIGFVFALNMFNMFAGFNGMETGIGAIMAFFFSLLLFLSGDFYNSELLRILFGALLGFFIFNRYPSKLFPGDIGTNTISSAIFGIAILSGFWYVLPLLFLPHLFDTALKFYSGSIIKKILKRKGKSTFSEYKPLEYREGKLHLPKKSYLSLIRLIIKNHPMSEPKLVNTILFLELLCGIGVLLLGLV